MAMFIVDLRVLDHHGVTFFAAIAMAMPVGGAIVGMLIERLAYRPVRDAPAQRIHHRLGADHLMLGRLNLLMLGPTIQTPYQNVFEFGGLFCFATAFWWSSPVIGQRGGSGALLKPRPVSRCAQWLRTAKQRCC
jgi:branched-subunit amino acid ABC-type transport system permease component